MAKQKKAVHKGKKPHKNKPTSQKWKHYVIEGETAKPKRYCPRCGPAVFLSVSKDGRLHCGKCHYTEFAEKKKEPPKE